jgi:hypothetical protein
MKLSRILVGMALLPLLAAITLSLWDQISVWVPAQPWRSAWFWSLWGGAVTWLAVFMALPRPVWVYVLGHELTHALATYLAGGKVRDFQVSSRGGYVAITKANWWITLSPYFVPLYSLIWLALWISVNFYYPLSRYTPVLFFGLGLTYAFHVSFTLSMIHPRQSDLKVEGYVFSYVVIAVANLLLIWLCLVPANPAMGWKAALWQFGARVWSCYWVVGKTAVVAAAKIYYAIAGSL